MPFIVVNYHLRLLFTIDELEALVGRPKKVLFVRGIFQVQSDSTRLDFILFLRGRKIIGKNTANSDRSRALAIQLNVVVALRAAIEAELLHSNLAEPNWITL